LTGGRVASLASLSLLDDELAHAWQDEFTGALELLFRQGVQFVEQVANLSSLEVELIRKVREQLHLAHAPGVCHASSPWLGARVISSVVVTARAKRSDGNPEKSGLIVVPGVEKCQ